MGKTNTLLRFQIGHFPQKVSNEKLKADLEWIKSQRVLSGGLTEMALRKEGVQSVLGPSEKHYHVFWDTHNGRPTEIPMIVNKADTENVRYHYVAISPGDPDISFVQPRGVSILKWTMDGEKFAQIHTHWDAVLQNKETGQVFEGAQRVAWAKKSAAFIERIATRLIKLGYAVFITGDFNYRDFPRVEQFRLWNHSPQKIFKRLGLDYHERHLDYLAWDPRLVRKLAIRVVTTNTRGNHGDHPYLIGSFAWAS